MNSCAGGTLAGGAVGAAAICIGAAAAGAGVEDGGCSNDMGAAGAGAAALKVFSGTRCEELVSAPGGGTSMGSEDGGGAFRGSRAATAMGAAAGVGAASVTGAGWKSRWAGAATQPANADKAAAAVMVFSDTRVMMGIINVGPIAEAVILNHFPLEVSGRFLRQLFPRPA